MNDFLLTSFQILVLLNPFAVLTTFLALTAKESYRERMLTIWICAITTFLSGILLLFSGNLLFTMLGINADLFKAGGGVILMICAVSLVWGRESKKEDTADQSHGLSAAVVPLAIPMAVGPGTSAGLIVTGSESSGFAGSCWSVASLGVATCLLAVVLLTGAQAERFLHKTGIMVVTRLTGLFLSAIAAKMILEGVKNTLSL